MCRCRPTSLPGLSPCGPVGYGPCTLPPSVFLLQRQDLSNGRDGIHAGCCSGGGCWPSTCTFQFLLTAGWVASEIGSRTRNCNSLRKAQPARSRRPFKPTRSDQWPSRCPLLWFCHLGPSSCDYLRPPGVASAPALFPSEGHTDK